MKFLVRFIDGEEIWLPYTKDLKESLPFMRFCERCPPLTPLLTTEKDWRSKKAALDARPIEEVKPGEKCYVDLRAWGGEWFEMLKLPFHCGKTYVVECKYVKYDNRTRTRMLLRCDLFGQEFVWKNSDILCYGKIGALHDDLIVVDRDFCNKYPQING